MFKLDLEKAKEPEIKLQTSAGSQRKQENSRKTSTSASLTMPKPSSPLCGSQQTVESSSRDGNARPHYLPPVKPVAGQEATVRTGHRTMDCYIVTLLI